MNAKLFCGNEISRLCLGTANMPEDREQIHEMVHAAMQNGINLYEAAAPVTEALSVYPRDSYYLLGSISYYDLRGVSSPEEIFQSYLSDTGSDHFDYFILKDIDDVTIRDFVRGDIRDALTTIVRSTPWNLTRTDNAVMNFLHAQHAECRIRHLGFSTVGSVNTMKIFLNFCSEGMDFCALNNNMIDYFMQDGQARTMILRMTEMDIMSTQPLRGGMLAECTPEFMEYLSPLRPGMSPVEWSFRWLQSSSNSDVFLCGMSSPAEIEENSSYCSVNDPITLEEDSRILMYSSDIRETRGKLSCIRCGHCLPYCPVRLNIPMLMNLRMNISFDRNERFIRIYRGLADNEKASACIICGRCMEGCDLRVNIPRELKNLDALCAGCDSN